MTIAGLVVCELIVVDGDFVGSVEGIIESVVDGFSVDLCISE